MRMRNPICSGLILAIVAAICLDLQSCRRNPSTTDLGVLVLLPETFGRPVLDPVHSSMILVFLGLSLQLGRLLLRHAGEDLHPVIAQVNCGNHSPPSSERPELLLPFFGRLLGRWVVVVEQLPACRKPPAVIGFAGSSNGLQPQR